MKLISWNVNGLRACLNKGFLEFFHQQDADVICLQETKAQPDQVTRDLPGYRQYWNSAIKKGYSGTAVFSRIEPLSVRYGLGIAEHDQEGRVITLEFADFYLVTVYTPNAQRDLARIDYREQWEEAFRAYLVALDQDKPVVVCGDMNVARSPMDLKNDKANEGNAGYSPQEREKMRLLLQAGFVDTFRALHPDTIAYTWWSYMFHAREKNSGWRIDYFLASQRMMDRVEDSLILGDVMGSDHCPVALLLR